MGRRYKNLHDRLRYRTDLRLLEVVQHGRPAFNANGEPVLDDEGNQMRHPPTSADLNAAIKRLKDVGLTEPDVEDQSTTRAVAKRLRSKGRKSDESDVAGRIANEG